MLTVYNGDCLKESDRIADGSVDLILTDLPYGTIKGLNSKSWENVRTEWDTVIDTYSVYRVAERVLRKNGKMVLFCQEPFTTELINKARPGVPFCYRMAWVKPHFANALGAKKAPVNRFEDVLVFRKLSPKHDHEGAHPLRAYFKNVFEFIGETKKELARRIGQRADHVFRFNSSQFSLCTRETYDDLVKVYGVDGMAEFTPFDTLEMVDAYYREALVASMNAQHPSVFNLWQGGGHKSNILEYGRDREKHHPTQKPVLLLEDLIKTYTNEGDTVLDLTMGSGSTGVACQNTGRAFIGIEKDPEYFGIATGRMVANV